jgi:hypothetical protein
MVAYGALEVCIEGVGDNQAVEGAGARGEASGNHIVDDMGDTDRVALPGALHELLHEGEPKALLSRR